jgi:hypothetical protein
MVDELSSIKTNQHLTKYFMKYILIFLTSLLCLTAVAQTTTKKEVYCDNTDKLLLILQNGEFEETPIWFGKGDGKAPNYSLLVNQKTKSWTMIQFNNEIACVIGTGDNFNLLNKQPAI